LTEASTSLTGVNEMVAAEPERVAEVRAFSRFYTNLIGILREGLLHTPYTLTEARLIYELAQRESSQVSDLRRTLDIDADYLSRILTRYEADGLIARERSVSDGRKHVIPLTT
jgi:DNA-binding MarR family transcriptional regulator